MEQIFIFSCLAGIIAILYGFITARKIINMPAGTTKMQEISKAIQVGASAYLKRQYFTIAIVGACIFIIIGYLLPGYLLSGPISGLISFRFGPIFATVPASLSE